MPAKRRLLSLIAILALTFLITDKAAGQDSQIPIAPDTIEFVMNSVISRSKENELLKRESLTYKRKYTVDNLSDNEQVTDRDTEEAVRIEFGGSETLIEKKKNGKPVKSGKASKPKFDFIRILETMTKLHNFKVVRIEMIWNRPHYVVNFEPKSQQKTSGDIEEVLIRSQGVMYIDIEKFYIRKISAWMTRPYSRVLGIFSLTRANIDMEQEDLGGIIVMKSIEIIDKYSFFGETFEKQVYLYGEYQRKQ